MENRYQLYIGQMLVGYAIGWSAPVTSRLQGIHPPGHLPFVMTHLDAIWITSLLFIGNLIGLYISWVLHIRKGCKLCLLLASVLCNLSFLMIAQAKDIAMFYAARIFMGMGTGIIYIVNVICIGEDSTSTTRSTLLTRGATFSSIGTLLIFVLGPYVSYVKSAYCGFALSMTYAAVLFFEQGTATILTMNVEDNEAKETLTTSIQEDSAKEPDEKNEFLHKSAQKYKEGNRRPLYIVTILCILQQFCGAMPILLLATDVLESALSLYVADLATISIGIVQLCASLFAPYALKRFRRRCLLLISTGLCSLSMLSLALYYIILYSDKDSIEMLGWLPIFALTIFFLSYGLGLGNVPNILISEMFPAHLRSSASVITITTSWTLSFFMTFTLGYFLYRNVQTFICFTIFTLSSAFAFYFVPETKGKTVVEIEEMFN